MFGRRLQAQIAKVGERVSMDCEVTGTPDPVVTWYKDGEQILGAVPGGPFRTKIQGNSYSLIIEKGNIITLWFLLFLLHFYLFYL